ncbi:uncharacterized protein NFIA_055120 [Aspergillus fischeri NRRL 181]|uniref:Acetyl-coenzyme A synthetase N-terminal domain-containing protein n=1 Tax=Neosartorya fischeri (strain ATCC 1020 / DSM 3700 / CBS 544.65 / FGSC A1164 / JCM 1740 / NRRL 181 / WB 181) TaxID=331117 RepID=A1DMZ2_NEOFI|nr:uncharacterized protein NFIA_055120 [Aspergillus fischeri NRRL 181]EAW16163.1 hypothetical protein NFIA_055120 [Aspergillus fischeri NRRL 181]KAG2000996.1 hypothetical protein GB937_010615 [Aspergillus fischeri]
MPSYIIHVGPDWRASHPSLPHLASLFEHHALYEQPSNHPSQFWSEQARQLLGFDKDFHTPHIGSPANGNSARFLGGKLNASIHCVDRHAVEVPDRIALIYEPDSPTDASHQTQPSGPSELGYGKSFTFASAGIVGVFVLQFALYTLNEERKRLSEDEVRQMYTEDELEGMEEKSPFFRYTL